MGYFAYAYIVDVIESDVDLLLTRSIYTVDLRHHGQRALFSWDQGERPDGMHAYANGALFCSNQLSLLPGYPLTRRMRHDEHYFIDEGFAPQADTESVLYHLTLPAHFVPCPDRPLTNPSQPNVSLRGDGLASPTEFRATQPSNSGSGVCSRAKASRTSISIASYKFLPPAGPRSKPKSAFLEFSNSSSAEVSLLFR